MEHPNQVHLPMVIKNIISSFFQIASLETQLTGTRLAKIIVLAVVGAVLLASTWVSLLAILLLSLTALNLSWLQSCYIVALVNVFMLVIVAVLILQQKKALGFHATRRQLSNLFSREDSPNV